jgi:hypothetical protein
MFDKLSDKSRVDEIAKKAVDAALPTLTSSIRSHIHPSEAAAGVTQKSAKVNAFGVFGVGTVTGHDRYGVPYAKIANVLEYGRHDRKPPHKPWRAASASSAEPASIKIMEEIIKSEMGCD